MRRAECRNATFNQVADGPPVVTPLWGFTIRLSGYELCSSLGAGLNLTITEPNGSSYQHYAGLGGQPPPSNGTACPPSECSFLWFTPDNESGVSYDALRTPQLLALVEAPK